MMTKKFGAIIIALVLTVPWFASQPFCCEKSGYSAVVEGAFYKWSAKLRVYDPSVGTYEDYWKAEHYLRILKLEEKGDNVIRLKVAYSTIYKTVFVSRYTTRDTVDRTVSSKHGSVWYELDLEKEKYQFSVADEHWGFGLKFPFTPFTIFNVEEHGFKQFFENTYIVGPVAGEIMERGVLFETWDIIMGTKRDVYYAEIYFRTLDMNISESKEAVTQSSITETNIEVDKQVGIVLKVRYFIDFADKMFEVLVSLTDTNMLPKHRFTMLILSLFIAAICIWIIIRYYRGLRRKRLIRI